MTGVFIVFHLGYMWFIIIWSALELVIVTLVVIFLTIFLVCCAQERVNYIAFGNFLLEKN